MSSDKEIAEDVANKLLGREKCKDCGKSFLRKDMEELGLAPKGPSVYVCKECEKQYDYPAA